MTKTVVVAALAMAAGTAMGFLLCHVIAPRLYQSVRIAFGPGVYFHQPDRHFLRVHTFTPPIFQRCRRWPPRILAEYDAMASGGGGE